MRPLWMLSKMGRTNHMCANLPSVVRTTCVLISTLPAALFSTYTRAFSRTNHMRANLHTTSAFSTVIVVKVVVVIYIVIVISTDASAYFPLLDVIQVSAVISGCCPRLPGPSICALLDIYHSDLMGFLRFALTFRKCWSPTEMALPASWDWFISLSIWIFRKC